MNTAPSASNLSEPLPIDIIPGMTWGPFHYRRYRVFSWPWLKWRSVTAIIVITLYGLLALMGQLAAKRDWSAGFTTFGYFVTGGVLMVIAGPALATWIRHRRWKQQIETAAVIVAVFIGFISAGAFDYWASMGIQSSVKPLEIPAAQRRISQIDQAKIMAFNGLGFVLYFSISGGLACLLYFSERRRLSARAAYIAALDSDMRLAVLQAQVEPHFLFNTLASIRPLIRQDSTRAEKALDALADHLRATIPQLRASSDASPSTLGQQLEICASYLTVMQLRMGDRLHYHFAVPAELQSHAFPPLLLLTLVENAIKHGIEPKAGPGNITINARLIGKGMIVSVVDDGSGLQDGLSSGLGLANIRQQLSVRYGASANLSVTTRPEGGTVAEITIPS